MLLLVSNVLEKKSMRLAVQEELARFSVRCNALQEREGVADTIRGGGSELRRVQQRVY